MIEAFKRMHNAALELAQYASYAEIVGALSLNQKPIREWCDKVFAINHEINDLEIRRTSKVEHVGELNYYTHDEHGFTPSPNIIGDILTHTGNNKEYVITGFQWMSATDEWGFTHRAIGEHGIELVRPLSHLRGERSNGYTRYEEWQSYEMYYVEEPVIHARLSTTD